MSRKPADLLAPLFIGGMLSAFFLYFIRAGMTDLGRPSLGASFDLQSYFLPRFAYGSRSVLHGDLPLWNPFEFGGLPFLATGQPSVFYPPKILIYGFLPREAAHVAYLVTHYALAAGSMFYFLKRSGIRDVGGFVGSMVWAFSVPLLSSNYHPNRIANLAWIPLIFALSERAGLGNRRAFVALAVVVTLQLTAGYPEFPLDTAVLIGVHAVACWAFGVWRTHPLHSLVRIGGAFVLAGISAAAQLLPLAELGNLSNRSSLMPVSISAIVGAGPLVITVPGLFGFTALGLFASRRGPALSGFVFCLLMGAGGWRILHLVPGFSFIRFPLVWVYLSTFYFAWLAALGANELVNPENSTRRMRFLAAGVVVSTLGSALYVFVWHAIAKTTGNVATRLWTGDGTQVAWGVVSALVIASLGLYSRRRPVQPAVWMTAISLIVAAHLRAYPFGATPSSFSTPAPKGQAAGFADDNGGLKGRALAPDDVLYGFEVSDRIPSPLGVEDSFLPWRQRRIADRLGVVLLFAHMDWRALARARGYLDVMDVELVVAPLDAEDALVASGLPPVARAEGATFFSNPAHMGHAWVNYAVRTIPSEPLTLEYFIGPNFDPHHEVLLEQPTRNTFSLPGPTTEAATVPLSEHRSSATKESWDVELPRPGIFVVSESAYPGWEAFVDGHAARWLTANYILRGVELDRGRHRVSFEYQPRSFRLGVALSLAGLLALALVGAWRGGAGNATRINTRQS